MAKTKPLRLFAETLGGNVFEATRTINKHCSEIIPGIVALVFTGGNYSTLIYRATEEHPYFVRHTSKYGTFNPLGIGVQK